MKNKTLASHISQYTNTLKNPPNLSQNLYQMSETNKDSVPKIIRIILMDDEEELNAELKKYDYSINTAYCGKSPPYYAIQFNSERCVKILLDREAESDPSGHRNRNQRRNKTPKHTECYHNCFATANHIHLEQLLSMENVDRYIQLPLNNGDSFLHSAVQQRKKNYKTKNQEKIIKLLILSGASVNAKNVNGNTPLHLVKDVRTAKILYGFGASLHWKNSTNQTPAQYFNKNLDDGDEDEDYCILNEWFKLAAEQEKIIEKKIKEATEDTSRPIEVDPDSDINK